MDPHQVNFQVPEVAKFTNDSRSEYMNWKFTLFRSLDWHQLRPFVEGTATAPPADATGQERLAYEHKKIMAYSILRDSVYDWLLDIFEDLGHFDEDFEYCEFLFDSTYDAKQLWDRIHHLVPDYIRC
ncbi:hypothetical protein C8A01DRAFT_41317 [Parachaetomium inaequale]|uniref:Uncharacterized protein n=1 Tax=Parachaetomium inaequale TaxID=2588326 RepID=A0AAN6SM00_9PEZI|nr:hypothetical protein C8A01DRAFT_41317 [Parachaetomium inaequale]